MSAAPGSSSSSGSVSCQPQHSRGRSPAVRCNTTTRQHACSDSAWSVQHLPAASHMTPACCWGWRLAGQAVVLKLQLIVVLPLQCMRQAAPPARCCWSWHRCPQRRPSPPSPAAAGHLASVQGSQNNNSASVTKALFDRLETVRKSPTVQ